MQTAAAIRPPTGPTKTHTCRQRGLCREEEEGGGSLLIGALDSQQTLFNGNPDDLLLGPTGLIGAPPPTPRKALLGCSLAIIQPLHWVGSGPVLPSPPTPPPSLVLHASPNPVLLLLLLFYFFKWGCFFIPGLLPGVSPSLLMCIGPVGKEPRPDRHPEARLDWCYACERIRSAFLGPFRCNINVDSTLGTGVFNYIIARFNVLLKGRRRCH